MDVLYQKLNILLDIICNSFCKHFKNKIAQIYASFPGSASICNVDFPVVHHPCTIFKPASLIEVSKLILLSLNKTSELDPVCTFLQKSCLHVLIVPITKIINLSLSSGVFSSHFKYAHVTPFLIIKIFI